MGFAAGKFHSVFIDQPADAGIHSAGQTCDLFRKACFFQTILYSGSVNALHFLCHVFGNAGFQNGKVLKNGGKQSVIVAAVILPDILSVQENPPFRWVKKTAYKADQSGFSGAVETDNGEFFPGMERETDMRKGIRGGSGIVEGDILQTDFTGGRGNSGKGLSFLKQEGLRIIQKFPYDGQIHALPVQL